MKTKSVSKIVIALVAGVAAIAAFYSWRIHALQQVTAPSDDELIKIFQTHRDEFTKLRTMVEEDIREASFFSETNIPAGLPASRRKEYKKLLKLSSGLMVGVNYDGSVRFIFASVGQAVSSGWTKGIQFVPNRARVVGTQMASLDGVSKLPAGVYLREIAPRWFLFYQRDD